MSNIYAKLIKVQYSLKAPKGQYNNFGKYAYRNCEDILEAVKPLLKENELTLFIYDEVVLIGDRYYMKATACLVDVDGGETVQNVAFAREEEMLKGMSSAQVSGSTSSYARKYALNGLFLIDDTKDTDTTNETPKGEYTPEQRSNSPQTPPQNKNTSSQGNTPPPAKKCSKAMLNKMYAVAQSKGYSVEQVKKLATKKYKVADITDMTPEQLNEMMTGYEGLADKGDK